MDGIPYTVEARSDSGLFNAKLGIWLFLASEVMLFGALFSSYILFRVSSTHWPLGSTILNVPIGAFNTVVLISSSVTVVLAWLSLKMRDHKKFKLYLGLTILCAFLFLMVKAYEYGMKFEIEYEKSFPALPGIVFNNFLHKIAAMQMGFKVVGAMIAGAGVIFLINLAKKKFSGFVKTISLILGLIGFVGIILMLFECGNRHSHHNYPPSYSIYMAIYFTLTGLHGLHVIGGIVVMSYLWGPGTVMWNADPERFTNRIEIAGLYWHFVDLVWIFLFPVLYLL